MSAGDGPAEPLLAFLRSRTQHDELAYAEPPRRLSGGFFADNYAFRLRHAPPEWAPPLVLRLYPNGSPADLPQREATVQNALRAQGLSTAPVLLYEEDPGVLGRRFLIMEFLGGRALVGGISPRDFVGPNVRLLTGLGRVLAEVEARLHRSDPTAVVDALGEGNIGVDRWLHVLATSVEGHAPELGAALAWLRRNRPAPAPTTICHGDLWPGNLLAADGHVTAVLDWGMATVAEPAFDVGFTAMALTIAPMDVPAPFQAAMLWFSRRVARDFVGRYRDLTDADLTAQPWYEALRAALELETVIDYRRAVREGRPRDTPRPTWDRAGGRLVDYFRARTGLAIAVPPPVA